MGLRDAGHNATRRLAVIADELTPKRAPWWVSQPGGQTPSQGWWWIPADASSPSFLGHNRVAAEINLLQLRDSGYPATSR